MIDSPDRTCAITRCPARPYWHLCPYGRPARGCYSCRRHLGMVADSLYMQYRATILIRRID